jgi:Mrr restriction endonuclease-like protein
MCKGARIQAILWDREPLVGGDRLLYGAVFHESIRQSNRRSASPRKERQRISQNYRLYSGKQMATPKYYECMNPVLTALREGGGTLTNEEIVDAAANIMHLPDDVMNRKQQGHNMGEVEYRIAWAKSYLKKAGYLTQSARRVWVLTA